MSIQPAIKSDCYNIAALAMIAGEGFPEYFWEIYRRQDETLMQVGARNARSEYANFSYKNTWLMKNNVETLGMLLAYKLPNYSAIPNPLEYPEFIRPFVYLENQVPESFYINMLACFERHRNKGIGTQLLDEAQRQAKIKNCKQLSIQVFEENKGALKLYLREGFTIIDEHHLIQNKNIPVSGNVLLMIRPVGGGAIGSAR